jgi:uncharacterized protein YigE (DUF2233 family)
VDLTPLAAVLLAAASAWAPLADGLDLAELTAPQKSDLGDSRVTVVRIDPSRYRFRLLSAKLLKLDRTLTAREWVERYGVLGAVNASMYQQDHRTSVAYMKGVEGVNNGRWTKDNAVFAADPMAASSPAVQIFDRTCAKSAEYENGYRILIQNIRMLDCAGKNTWSEQPRKWSTAAVGIDDAGRVLFIHCRSPYSTHDFIEILRALPLDLRRLMYVEGGPEASLYVAVKGHEPIAKVGSFETGFRELDDNRELWPIPNVLAFDKR